MEKEVVKNHHHSHHSHSTSNNNITSTSTSNLRERHVIGDGLLKPPQSSDFVLRWGNRKRLRCMKIQVKNETIPASRTTVRVDRRVIRSEGNTANNSNGGAVASSSHAANGHFNLRQRPASPAQPPPRLLRHNNTEGGSTMKGLHINHNNNNNNINNGNSNNNYNQSNGGGIRGLASPDRGEKKGGGAHHAHEINGGGGRTASSETKNGTSSGGANDVIWPPKFMIALTNKEKEEDFMAIKGSKLPQRPKKRAKFIQRTLNLVSPGGWLGDLTLERYEVREKKISKKRPRGLKAMGSYMDSDSD